VWCVLVCVGVCWCLFWCGVGVWVGCMLVFVCVGVSGLVMCVWYLCVGVHDGVCCCCCVLLLVCVVLVCASWLSWWFV
jgi:hypothetical protein